MDRQQLLRRLETAWRDFQLSHAGLTEEQLLERGVTGKWSVRDILAHVTTWEEEALKHLPAILRGERPPSYAWTYGGIDAFNARMTERKKTLSLPEVFRQMKDVHNQLIGYLAHVPGHEIRSETRFRHRLRLDTYSHYPKHAAAIRRWREKNGQAGALESLILANECGNLKLKVFS
jgi:hypothetical protein